MLNRQQQLEQQLREVSARGGDFAIIALEALQEAISDVRYPLGDNDSLELRNAVIAVLKDGVDKIKKYRKII